MTAATSTAGSATAPRGRAAQSTVRSLAPDLARGLMLAMIALANVSWFLWGRPAVGASAHPLTGSTLDRVLQTIVIITVDGRIYPLFAFLFGYGIVQFFRSRMDRGVTPKDVRRMLRRRHWAMILLGFLHAALLFMGDILATYGLIGLVLVWILFGRSTRVLSVIAGVMSLAVLAYALMSMAGAAALLMGPPEALEAAAGNAGFSAETMKASAHGNESFLAGMIARIGNWAFILVQQLLMPMIPVAIILGWIAARHRVLDEPWAHRRLLTWVAIGGITGGVLGGLPSGLKHLGVLPLPDGLFWAFMGLHSLTGLIGGIGCVALFALLATMLDRRAPQDAFAPGGSAPSAPPALPAGLQGAPAWALRAYGRPARPYGEPTEAPGLLVRAVAAVGKRSLTFYLAQSVVWALVLSSTGFGLGATISPTAAFLLALATWALCLPVALLLESRGMRGPAEVLLRRLTYGARR